MKLSKKEILMIAGVVFVCSMVMSLTGCGAPNGTIYQHQGVEYIGNGGGNSDVKVTEVTLQNGLECIYIGGAKRAGITCNWEKFNKERGDL